MEPTMKTPARWAILLFAVVFTFAGCADKKPDEPAKQQPAPQTVPRPADAPPNPAQTPTKPPEPAKPDAAPQRPKQEPSPSPVSEPPTLVPDKNKPGAPKPPEATPPSKEVAKPAPKEEAKPAVKEEPKPAPAQPQPPKPTAKPKDVVVLTGSPMGTVRLAHSVHAQRAGNNCATCHHASKPEKPASAPQQACSDCHTKVATPPMKTKRQAAFHNPTAQSGTCIDCHKTENAKGKKAPVKCVDCHKKETR
jgi:hypothetical protein